MGRRRLEKKLSGLLRRSEEAQQERTEPQLSLSRLTDSELELLDRLLAKFMAEWGEFENPESEIWWTALLAKAFRFDAAIPSDLPPPPELPHPGSYTEEVERGGLFTARTDPDDPRLLAEGGTEDST